MRVKYVGVSFGIDCLTNGKEYEVIGVDKISGALIVIDDSGEDYLYSPIHPRPLANSNHPGGIFEIVEDNEQHSLYNAIYAE